MLVHAAAGGDAPSAMAINSRDYSCSIVYCSIGKHKSIFCGSCTILVLRTVLGRPRPSGAKRDVKTIRGQLQLYFPRKCDSKKIHPYVFLNFSVIMN